MSAALPYSLEAFRRGTIHFLLGKAGTAFLTFILFLLLARGLSVPEYGAYVTLVALVEFGFTLSSAGLDWVLERYLPEAILKGSRAVVFGFFMRIMLLRLTILAVIAGGLALTGSAVSGMLQMGAFQEAVLLYCAVMVVEGVAQIWRERGLNLLLLQGYAQVSLLSKNAAFLIGIWWLGSNHLTLNDVAMSELAASSIGLMLAVAFMARQFVGGNGHPRSESDWRPPAFSSCWHLARNMYMSELLTFAYGPQIFTLIVNRWLGLEAAGVFGFVRNFAQLVYRYMPAELLMSVIRPKLVAAFSGNGDIKLLQSNALLIWKLSLFMLVPVLVFFAVYGEEFFDLSSKGKYVDATFLAMGMLCTLIPASQRRVLETIAAILGRSKACVVASAAGVLMLPVTLMLLWAGAGLWSVIIALFAGQVAYNALVIRDIKAHGFPYMFPVASIAALGGAALITGLILKIVPVGLSGWIDLVVGAATAAVVFLCAAYFLRPFSARERDRINALIRKPVFVW